MFLYRPTRFMKTVQPCNWKYDTVQMLLNCAKLFMATVRDGNGSTLQLKIWRGSYVQDGLASSKIKKNQPIFSREKSNVFFSTNFNNRRKVLMQQGVRHFELFHSIITFLCCLSKRYLI